MRWRDGSSYTGTWSLGYAHGRGTFIDTCGNMYEGGYYMSMKHGYGVFVNTQGQMYEGEWRYDRKEGKGKETWDNCQYEGGYHKG
jgi:hypothetical protein